LAVHDAGDGIAELLRQIEDQITPDIIA